MSYECHTDCSAQKVVFELLGTSILWNCFDGLYRHLLATECMKLLNSYDKSDTTNAVIKTAVKTIRIKCIKENIDKQINSRVNIGKKIDEQIVNEHYKGYREC